MNHEPLTKWDDLPSTKKTTQFEHLQFFVHEPGYKLVALYHGFGIMSNEKGGGFLLPVSYDWAGQITHAIYVYIYIYTPIHIYIYTCRCI